MVEFGAEMSGLKVDFGAEIPSLGVGSTVEFGVEMLDFGGDVSRLKIASFGGGFWG